MTRASNVSPSMHAQHLGRMAAGIGAGRRLARGGASARPAPAPAAADSTGPISAPTASPSANVTAASAMPRGRVRIRVCGQGS